MNGLPLNDWQFWIATASVAVAVWFVVRTLLPRRGKGAACPNCPSKSSSGQDQPAQLTIDGAKPRRA